MSLLEVEESSGRISRVDSFLTDAGIRNISASPFDSRQIVASFKDRNAGSDNVGLCALNEDDAVDSTLKIVSSFDDSFVNVHTVLFESAENICVGDSGSVSLFSIESGKRIGNSFNISNCTSTVIDPHKPFTVAASSGKRILFLDTRSGIVENEFLTSHFFDITCMDLNPNVPNQYVTGGLDGRVMFWDTRMTGVSVGWLKMAVAHTHRVSTVKYNPLHDQLVLSSGTDCKLNLFRFPSLSKHPGKYASIIETQPKHVSGQTAHLARRGSVDDEPKLFFADRDGLIRSYSRHEDSVYKACWAANNTWLFASLSHDGIFLINRVPREDKFRIMT